MTIPCKLLKCQNMKNMTHRILFYTFLIVLLLGVNACNSPHNKPTKVIVLGFDGAGWPTLDPLIKEGKLPFIKKLKDEGAWAAFKTDVPTKSSVVWTSIATGKTMAKHGIMDFVFLNKNNIQSPFSNSEKREPSIWQILDEYNLKSIVINWFVTYPPDRINGILVSDQFREILHKSPEVINNHSDSVYPTINFYRLKPLVNNNFNKVRSRISMPDFQNLYKSKYGDSAPPSSPGLILNSAARFIMQDALVESVTDELFLKDEAELYLTYFRLPDIVQHFALRMLDDQYILETFGTPPDQKVPSPEKQEELYQKISHVLEPVYVYMESIIKKYMTHPKFRDATFLIMSDHGFKFYPGGYNHYHLLDKDPPKGIFMMKGPGVKKGQIEAGIYDVAPTILYLFGLALDPNMDGKPLLNAFTFSKEMKYKAYKLIQKTVEKKNRNADQEQLDSLKSLGYID